MMEKLLVACCCLNKDYGFFRCDLFSFRNTKSIPMLYAGILAGIKDEIFCVKL